MYFFFTVVYRFSKKLTFESVATFSIIILVQYCILVQSLNFQWHLYTVFILVIFFFYIHLFIYLFIFGCVGSSPLCEGSLQLRRAGATLHRGARASHCCGLSRCRAQAPDAQAQQLWLTGLVAPRHVGSSQTRARTPVPCIGRQTLHHCATREALSDVLTYSYEPIR